MRNVDENTSEEIVQIIEDCRKYFNSHTSGSVNTLSIRRNFLVTSVPTTYGIRDTLCKLLKEEIDARK